MQSDFSSHSLAVFLLIGSAYPYFTSESTRQCQPVIISSCQTRQGLHTPDPPLYLLDAFPSRGTRAGLWTRLRRFSPS